MKTEPKSMHCDWGMMRDETNWDKTDGISELRGRLDRIREGFESAVEAPLTHERKLVELRFASAKLKSDRETEFAAIDEAIATQRAVVSEKATHSTSASDTVQRNHDELVKLKDDLLAQASRRKSELLKVG